MKLWRMEKMFKKSLLALALTTAASSVYAVPTSVTSATTVSVEGQAATTTVTSSVSPEVTLTLGAEYTVGDIITVTATGAEFSDTAYHLVGSANVTFGLLNATKTELTFRVTSRTAATVTTGETLNLKDAATGGNDLNFAIPDLAKGATVKVTAVAKTSTGIVIDTAGTGKSDSATIFQGVQQFSIVSNKDDATVDVAELRKKFVNTAGTTTEDVPAPSFTATIATATVAAFTNADVEFKLAGNFTGIAGITIGGKAATIAADKLSATAKTGAAFAAGAYNVVFTMPADAKREVLTAPQNITATVNVLNSTTAPTASANVVAAGTNISTWSLNGDSEFIEYVPFHADFRRSFAVTNNGTVEGDIMVELFADGKMVAASTVGTATKYTVTDISAAVNKLAADNSIEGFAGVRVTTNAPSANIEVTGLFYSVEDGDRVLVK